MYILYPCLLYFYLLIVILTVVTSQKKKENENIKQLCNELLYTLRLPTPQSQCLK